MKVVIGGTFEFLHKAHRTLIDKAFEIGSEVTIGITEDGFKKGVSKSYEERAKNVDKYAVRFGKKYRIVKIKDIYGPTLKEDFDAIIVSPETKRNAEKINEARENKGMKRMKIVQIPLIVAEDLMPISSRRIRAGEIDEEGKRLKPMKVGIGSENPSKIKAVQMAFSRIFKFEIEYIPVAVDSGVSPQPFDSETVQGAINRAKKINGMDYAVGIEAGLFNEKITGNYLDRAYCAIIDKYGRMTLGHSSGFSYPPEIMEMVREGMEVGEAIEKISGIKEIKKKIGAIGFLSKGLINRDEFNAQAVLMAMLPRISSELYF